MEFSGDFETPARRALTWEFVMDPHRMAPCGPGVRDVEVLDDTHYRITARVGIGAIAATFRIDAELIDVNERESATVRVTAQAPGTAVEGVAAMSLSDVAVGTRMDWNVTVQISGKLAAVGERLIRGTADRLIQQTFACIGSKLEAEAHARADDGAVAQADPGATG